MLTCTDAGCGKSSHVTDILAALFSTISTRVSTIKSLSQARSHVSRHESRLCLLRKSKTLPDSLFCCRPHRTGVSLMQMSWLVARVRFSFFCSRRANLETSNQFTPTPPFSTWMAFMSIFQIRSYFSPAIVGTVTMGRKMGGKWRSQASWNMFPEAKQSTSDSSRFQRLPDSGGRRT